MQIRTVYGTWETLRLTIVWVGYAAIEARKGKPGHRVRRKAKSLFQERNFSSITRESGWLGVVSSIVVGDGESPLQGEGLDGST